MQLRIIAAIFLVGGAQAPAARLSPSAERAFDDYVAGMETRLASRHARPATYLSVFNTAADRAAVERLLTSGAIQSEPVNGGTWRVDGALLHHWRAAAFVPGATANDMLALLRDYDHLDRYYAPTVVSSRVLKESGGAVALAMRLKEQLGLTIVLDTEYSFEAHLSGKDRGSSISRSTHVWQIDNPGTSHEHRRDEGRDDGFLWRLNSYWSFALMGDGLVIECEAVSLTRDVPMGLGWLMTPIISNFPRTSLEFTLKATKDALAASAARRSIQ